MNVITKPVGCNDCVDPLLWAGASAEFRRVVEQRLLDTVRDLGLRYGHPIRPQSVFMLEPVRVSLGMLVRAVWSPDPMEGVELWGGALDGARVAIARQADGYPVERIEFDTGAVYRREGIHGLFDRWVYVYDVKRGK